MKLNALRIPCKDLTASETFYTEIVGWQKTFGSTAEGYIGFDLDGVVVLLEPEEPGEFESGRYLGFSVAVSNLQQYFEEASARGLKFTGPPSSQDWGGLMTHICDCSGNSFSIVEQTQAN